MHGVARGLAPRLSLARSCRCCDRTAPAQTHSSSLGGICRHLSRRLDHDRHCQPATNLLRPWLGNHCMRSARETQLRHGRRCPRLLRHAGSSSPHHCSFSSMRTGDIPCAIQNLSQRALWGTGVVGQVWQRSFWDHFLRSDEPLEHACIYVLNNPVRAGMVEDWRKYPFAGVLGPRPV